QIIFTQSYSRYLDYYKELGVVDVITHEVANESSNLLELLGFESSILQNEHIQSVRFNLDGFSRITIVEGCNGVAVMAIFISFIFAFGGRIVDMLLFSTMGVMLIHLSNIFRISLLGYIYVYHHSIADSFHDYVFPVIIYGMVFVLWVIWVNYFVGANRKSVHHNEDI
ncbi:MAG: exosortase family protein XrtF, partial [Ichthyobacteriaceae bacterium]|nr:exosortase family protein XrtF [Ichthyobacteriaceae bacterium]